MPTSPTETAQELRKRAEEKLRSMEGSTPEMFPADDKERLFHELQVHRIELEMQNEELRRYQEELEASRSRYFALYDLAPVGYLTICENGLIKEANLTAGTMFGSAKNELYGKSMSMFVFREEQDNYYLARKRAVETAKPQNLEIRLIRTDGVLFWANLQVGLVLDGEYGITITDTTRIKKAEMMSLDCQSLLSSVIDGIPDPVYVKNIKGEYEYFNAAAEKFVGMKTSQVLGKDDRAIFYPTLAEKIMEKDRSIKDGGKTITFEETLTDSAGLTVQFWVTKGPLFDQKGKVIGLYGISRDITERKLMEEELRAAKLAAESANRAKSEFLANMSHEIRSPMNGLLGMAQLMEYTKLTKKQKEYLEVLKGSGKNLLSLINDILDLSKIEAGKIILEPGEFSLSQCIKDVILMQRAVAFEKHLKMDMDVAGNIPNVLMGDQLRIKQILLNLIGNAIKFTKQGGVSISVKLLNRHDNSVLVQIAVRDTGIGISPEALEHIFKAFVQADSSMTRKFGGTGLGLSISLNLAELMGGSISVESRPEVGSCFTITLPLACLPQIKPEVETFSITPHNWEGSSLRILLAEDNEVNIMFATALLKKIGHDVTVAENGSVCLDKLEQSPFDLVLMDIQMPVINGVEALREIRLREQKSGKHLPVIAVTAFSMRGDRERFLEEGFDGYVSKPFAINDLVIEMRRVSGILPVESVIERG